MTEYLLVPETYPIFNEFDKHGILLGLSRLPSEKNAEYKQRLYDVMVHRANSSYQGLINGITRELGLSITETLDVSVILDGDGNAANPYPALVFKDTKCYVYSDFYNNTLAATIDRFGTDAAGFTLNGLIGQINGTGVFTASLATGADGSSRAMTIFNQSSVNLVSSEFLDNDAYKIKLENENLVNDTVTIVSENLLRRVNSEAELSSRQDYYIDLTNGIVHTKSAPEPGTYIRYQYFNLTKTFESSPVIIHNIHSTEFKKEMFEDVDSVNNIFGKATVYGADIINELLSVYPAGFGA